MDRAWSSDQEAWESGVDSLLLRRGRILRTSGVAWLPRCAMPVHYRVISQASRSWHFLERRADVAYPMKSFDILATVRLLLMLAPLSRDILLEESVALGVDGRDGAGRPL